MARLTEEMVIARSKQSDLSAIKKLNCWGAELGDVTLLRRMPNVEVLALSINKIRTLGDFAGCRRLKELYIRKNDIRDLREIRHLRSLPNLTSLWLDENPCTEHPEYRMTVLRNLPNLEKLDNVSVQPEEVSEAMRRGVYILDSDDEGYPQQQQDTYGQCRRQRSCDSSPEREPPPESYSNVRTRDQGSDSSEGAPEMAPQEPRADTQQQAPLSPTRRAPLGGQSPESDDRFEYNPMTRSHYEPRTVRSPEDATLRHSLSAHSVKEYSYASNGECRGSALTSPHYQEQYYDRPERQEYQQVPQRCPAETWERESTRERGDSARERDREYPSAVMAEHRGFTRRPVTRNSNLLSAVLCLVKELDYPSLEVAEMAVRVTASDESVSYTEARPEGGMSARSSYDSWAGRDHAADIIDLDRYMRGGVRPQVRRRDDCDRLVVDAGGSTAVSGGPLVGSLAGSARVPSPLHKSSTSTASAPRDKRYSHDSGLSDGSYSRRRTHRRVMGENATMRAHRERERGRERTVKLSNSMRNFHATYERALRDQQDQIARVAELCERLTKNMNNERSGTAATTARKQSVSCTQDSSDISSSSISRSTRATKSQKDKHRTNECKTYKIIMNKLDELNRLFAVRARPVPATRRAPSLRPCAAPPGASSVTVSVSDKLVYTDPHLERKDKEHNKSSKNSPRLEEHGVAGKRSRRAIIARLATTRAHDVDIAPAKTNGAASPDKMRSGCINVATENVMECDTEGGDSVAESLCKFDLDNPLHFYHQAKHLQSPLNKTSTVHSINYCNIRTNANERNHVHTNYVSLCHRCQGYWKTLTDLVYHLFNRNDSTSSKSYVR